MDSLHDLPRRHNVRRRNPASNDLVDWREQLVNGGPIQTVSVAEDEIVSVRGIMLDFDPHLLQPHLFGGGTGDVATRFFRHSLGKWLNRHELWRKAEVRFSGTGLHVLLWADPRIELEHKGERERWSGIIPVLQTVFPTDPAAPGITALTRPVGSTNSKSHKTVTTLKSGQPVEPAAIVAFYEELQNAPFRTVSDLLLGSGPITPCPCCADRGTSMTAQKDHGQCYGRCGQIGHEQLMDLFFLPTQTERGQ